MLYLLFYLQTGAFPATVNGANRYPRHFLASSPESFLPVSALVLHPHVTGMAEQLRRGY
jgi:hypothetical protein